MIAYFNGRYLSKAEIAVSPDDRGFLFADGIYEVIRSYEGRLFQAPAHVERLARGAKALAFAVGTIGDLALVAETLIRENGLLQGDALVYFQVTRGAAPRTHYFPPPSTPLTVYADANPFLPSAQDLEEGMSAILVPDRRWARCDIKTVGLLANVLARQEARERGAGEALFVRDGCVMEGTHSNFFVVSGGAAATPQLSTFILDGINRRVVLDLCRDLSIRCEERPIGESEIRRADEVMVVGTTVEVTPVVRLEGERVGPGVPGPVTRRLQKAFRELIRQLPPGMTDRG
jgi:D-alanine transaminase